MPNAIDTISLIARLHETGMPALREALEGMIFSPSGWRGIFSASGEEEDAGEDVSPVHALIAAAGAFVFAAFIKKNAPESGKPAVILGMDTRPTGKTVADLMIRAFLASGCPVNYIGIAAAPEIMAFSKTRGGPFAYVSASHNPAGHNGLKFGLDGGVLDGRRAVELIEALKDFFDRDNALSYLVRLLEQTDGRLRTVYEQSECLKREALAAYRDFSGLVIGGSSVFEAVWTGLAGRPLGIAVDFNGSARTLSIDREFFESLGIGFRAINEKPGGMAHAIIPEGESLEPCRAFLERLHAADASFTLGYVPDCDGDRGNLVVWDEQENRGRILEAQEVFALTCIAELAHMVWSGELAYDADGEPRGKTAVAVNGPTSMRIDRIARAFGAEVFRAEVGEANVVHLARALREQGRAVRILGEGSNGGSIIHPSAVRDPLATLFAMIKLLTVQDGGPEGKGLFCIWLERAARAGIVSPGISGAPLSLAALIASLPRFFTTEVSTPEAKLQVVTRDHRLLKERYQSVFIQAWEEKKEAFKQRWGITGWEGRACTGPEEKRNLSNFGNAGTGGLKIVFKTDGRDAAFIWMRGSKTEPVFRIMADAEDPCLERELILWQSEMTETADRLCQGV